jgi:hypothetical protein
MEVRRRPLLQATSLLLLAAQLVTAVPLLTAATPAMAAATAAKPSALLARAEGFYRDGRYDEAVGLLAGPVLRKELSGDELRDARIVLARCYVKKGMLPRAKEHFGALLAADPAFVLTSDRADAEELAVFAQVKGGSAPAAPVAAKPDAPAVKGQPAKGQPAKEQPAKEQPAPTLHKPEVETASASASKPGWLSRNKYLALAVVAGGGLAVGLAGGGGGGGSTPPGPRNLAGFPAPPGGH